MNSLENLKNYIDECIRSKVRRRRLYTLVAILSTVVAFCVTMEMVKPAVTATAQPQCGYEDHVHTQQCYEKCAVCGQSDVEGHQHEETCYAMVLICPLKQHAHNEACYPSEISEATLEPTQEPTPEPEVTVEPTDAVETPEITDVPTAEPEVTDEPTDAVETPEATDAPTPEPEVTVEPTDAVETPEITDVPTAEPEVTDEPTDAVETPEATDEPTAEPEVTDEPTDAVETPEATDAPTAEPEVTDEPTDAVETPEATDEPTAEPEVTVEPTNELQILEISAQDGTTHMLSGEEGVWHFSAQGAQTLKAEVLSVDGTLLAVEELAADAMEFRAVMAESGLYTVRVTAACGAEERSAEWLVAVSGGELKAAITADVLSCFGDDEVTFALNGQGGTAPVVCHVTVVQAGVTLFEADCEPNAEIRVTALTCEDVSEITAQMTLTGADGETAEVRSAVPCAVRRREHRAQWEASMAEVELEGVWPQDLLAIAASQIGYEESSVNFIINDEGKVQGYTRYGAWYGASYSEWCAMYVSFCLNYAEIPEAYFPHEANCEKWIRELKPLDLYEAAQDGEAQSGNLIFFDWEQDGKADHVGLIESIDGDELVTIEGNSRSSVRRNRYKTDDPVIFGYGLVNKAYEAWLEAQLENEPSEEPTDEVTVEPGEEPTAEVTVEPGEEPTAEETVEPSEEPTAEETVEPSEEPDGEISLEEQIAALECPEEGADDAAQAYDAQITALCEQIMAQYDVQALDRVQTVHLLDALAHRQRGGASEVYVSLHRTLVTLTQPADDASADVKIEYDTLVSALREQAAAAQDGGSMTALEATSVQLLLSDMPVCPVQCLYTALDGAVSVLHTENEQFNGGVLTAAYYDAASEEGVRLYDELSLKMGLSGQRIEQMLLMDIDFQAESPAAQVMLRLQETLAASENLHVFHYGADGWQEIGFERLTDENGQRFVTFYTETYSPFAVAALDADGAAGADVTAYIARNDGAAAMTLTDAEGLLPDQDENGVYTVLSEEEYILTVQWDCPEGFAAGAYAYVLPEGVSILAAESSAGSCSADAECVRIVLEELTDSLTVTLRLSFAEQDELLVLGDGMTLCCVRVPLEAVAEMCEGDNWKALRDSGYFEYWSDKIAEADAQTQSAKLRTAARTGGTEDDQQPSDEQIDKEGGENSAEDDGVSISKTISGTDIENVFDITLTVETSTEIDTFYKEPDMAVVIVMDISNTMNDNFGGVTRYAAAMEAAEEFLDNFTAKSAGVSKIGYVAFNTDAHQIFALTPCSTTAEATALKNTMRTATGKIINAAGYGESHSRFTNIEAGLKMASDMLESVSNENKYIILLTDGFPTTYIESGYKGYDPYDSTGKYFYDAVLNKKCLYGTSYSDKAAIKAREMATGIKNSGTTIFSIGVDVGGQKIQDYIASSETSSGHSIVDRTGTTYEIGDASSTDSYKNWLRNSIGSGYYYDSTNTAGLKDAYQSIFDKILEEQEKSSSGLWVTEDPMPMLDGVEYVELIGLYNKNGVLSGLSLIGSNAENGENTAAYESRDDSSSKAIFWDLKQSGYTTFSQDNTTIYRYTLTYRVRLRNETAGFSEDIIYDTNDETTLTYKTVKTVNGQEVFSEKKTLNYPIPSVHGYLAELTFDKLTSTDKKTAKPVPGAEFTLSHDTDTCSVCRGDGKTAVAIDDKVVTSDEDGTVTFERIPSGHTYTLTETRVPEGYYLSEDYQYTVTVAYDEITVTVTDGEGNNKEWNDVIVNKTSPTMPETGGRGTLPYAIGGIALMAISLLYGCTSGRRRGRSVKH